jgi:hypothetical protein
LCRNQRSKEEEKCPLFMGYLEEREINVSKEKITKKEESKDDRTA